MVFRLFTPWMHALLTLSIPERESTSMYVSVLKRSHRAGKLLATLELYAEYGDNKAQQHHSHSNNSLSLAYSTWSIRWPCFVLFRNGTSAPRGPLGAHGSRGGTQCIRQGVLQSSGPTHLSRRKALLEVSWSSPGETMPSRCSERRRKRGGRPRTSVDGAVKDGGIVGGRAPKTPCVRIPVRYGEAGLVLTGR